MTDSVPEDQATATPPTADQQQTSAENRIKWTREHWLAFWANVASFLNVGFAAVAFLILVRTLWITQESLAAAQRSVVEAHEQAVQARRQADIAQQTLIATTRARLKLTAILEANVTRASNAPVAWFNFKATYKNLGQSPGQNVTFSPHIYVIGDGTSPTRICDNDKRPQFLSTNIVFPQDEGSEGWVGVQVPLDALEAGAAKVRAIQPSITIYLGMIGCLVYRSTGSDELYVTAIAGDLQPTSSRISLYDATVKNNGPVKVGMEVKSLNAWAD